MPPMRSSIDQPPIIENTRIMMPHFVCSKGCAFNWFAATMTIMEHTIIQTPRPPMAKKPSPKVKIPRNNPATIKSKPPIKPSMPPINDTQYAAVGLF